MGEENNLKTENDRIKPEVLRTYSSDMANVVRTDEVSVIKIALAEKAKKEREELFIKVEGTPTKKIFWVIAGIFFIVSAILGSYFAIQKRKQLDSPIIIKKGMDTFISYESNSSVDITTALGITDIYNIIKAEVNRQDELGLIKAIFLTKTTESDSVYLTSKDFISLIKSTAPPPLIRSLSDQYLMGSYFPVKSISQPFTKPHLFLVFQTVDYNQTYASMLEWEKTMLRDFFSMFDLDLEGDNKELLDKPWRDLIISNRDARVLYDINGNGILYYLFVNKNNLVISDSPEAINEIVSRIIVKNNKPL